MVFLIVQRHFQVKKCREASLRHARRKNNIRRTDRERSTSSRFFPNDGRGTKHNKPQFSVRVSKGNPGRQSPSRWGEGTAGTSSLEDGVQHSTVNSLRSSKPNNLARRETAPLCPEVVTKSQTPIGEKGRLSLSANGAMMIL